jgi:3',5'-cyclic AMP phosphodiesterase CpdA
MNETPRFRVRADGCFHILQLTDFHSDVSEELTARTWRDVRAMAGRYAPDLLAVTGDLWCGDEMPDVAPELMRQDLARLGALGVPWAFTWGNHDYVGDFEADLERIGATPNAVIGNADGRGNYRIELWDQGPRWDLFFLNSGARWNLPDDLAWFRDESARLVAERGRSLPALAFFHIPIKPYEDARLAGDFIGFGPEEVLYWGDEENLALPILRAHGNLRGCFAGHSHRNDFHTDAGGIILAYGRATGHGGYGGPDDPEHPDGLAKGGKRIVIDTRRDAFEFETVFA